MLCKGGGRGLTSHMITVKSFMFMNCLQVLSSIFHFVSNKLFISGYCTYFHEHRVRAVLHQLKDRGHLAHVLVDRLGTGLTPTPPAPPLEPAPTAPEVTPAASSSSSLIATATA